MTEKIVKDAARLTASEIRQMPYCTSKYPTVQEMSLDNDEVVPPLLRLFIQSLVRTELKQSSLEQVLIQASRPESCIMPVLFGLAAQLDHQFGSEFLLKHLSRLGFCASYDEVKRFKISVIHASCNNTVGDDNVQTIASNEGDVATNFTQFCADNIDHNMCTLDGNNTFHGMGMTAARVVDNVKQSMQKQDCIHRLTRRIKSSEIVQKVRTPIVSCFIKSGSGLSTIKLRSICSLQAPVVLPPVVNLNMLRHVSGLKQQSQQSELVRPSWAGFTQAVCTGEHPPVSI